MDKKEKSQNAPQILPPYGYIPYCPPEEDEIDLRELWATLKRRKRTVFWTTFGIFFVALMYIWFASPIYEAKTLMRIGSIHGKYLEPAEQLKETLVSKYHVGDKNIKINPPRLSSVSIPKKTSGLLQLTADGYDNQSAKKFIRQVIDSILEKHQKYLNTYIQLQKNDLSLKKEELNQVSNQIRRISELVSSLEKKAEKELNLDIDAYSLQITKALEKLSFLQDRRSGLQKEIKSIELSLLPINLKPTQIVGSITLYDHPVKPKKKLILAVSLITGLMLGVFLAFFLEFISKEKENG